MIAKRGTCASCGSEQDVVRGKIAEHSAWRRAVDMVEVPPPDGGRMCSGSGRSSKEARAKVAEAARRRSQRDVEAVRVTAGVVLDATEAGRTLDMGITIEQLLKLARIDLSLRSPKGSVRSLAEEWLWVRRSKHRGRTIAPSAHGDIYCRFCGEPLVMKVTYHVVLEQRRLHEERLFAERVTPHTTRCALQVLAGLRAPVAPGTRRLPEEFREDAA